MRQLFGAVIAFLIAIGVSVPASAFVRGPAPVSVAGPAVEKVWHRGYRHKRYHKRYRHRAANRRVCKVRWVYRYGHRRKIVTCRYVPRRAYYY